MPSVAEVVVSAKPDGVGDVESEMDNLESTTKETTENLDESAAMLGGLARKFKGGMLAIVGGLAIATAGVLSQVPVLGQAMDGLKAIFQAIAFQVDKKLRPFISDLSQEFFELADAIFAGNYGKAKQEIKDIINLFKNINVGKLLTSFKNLATDAIQFFADNINVSSLLKKFGSIASDAIDFLAQGFRNAENKISSEDIQRITSKLINLIESGLKGLINATDWSKLIGSIIDLMGKFQEGAKKAIDKQIVQPLTGFIEENWQDWVSAAIDFGKDLVENIAKGIRQNDTSVKQALSGMEIAGGVTLGDVMQVSTMGGPMGMALEQSGEVNDFIGSSVESQAKLFLDGREINKGVGRVRKDVLNRRG